MGDEIRVELNETIQIEMNGEDVYAKAIEVTDEGVTLEVVETGLKVTYSWIEMDEIDWEDDFQPEGVE